MSNFRERLSPWPEMPSTTVPIIITPVPEKDIEAVAPVAGGVALISFQNKVLLAVKYLGHERSNVRQAVR